MAALFFYSAFPAYSIHWNMGPDFDVVDFCRKLKSSKNPPYTCPIVECGKSYKSMCGFQYHLVHFDHSAPPPTTPVGPSLSKLSKNFLFVNLFILLFLSLFFVS